MRDEAAMGPVAREGVADVPERRDGPGLQGFPGRREGMARQARVFSWRMSSTGWFLIDFSSAYLSAWAAVLVVQAAAGAVDPLRAGIVAGAVAGLVGHVFGLHDTHQERREWQVLAKVGFAVLVAVAAVAVLWREAGAAYLAVMGLSAGLGMTAMRMLAWQCVTANRTRVCVIGGSDFCKRAGAFLRAQDAVKPVDLRTVQVDAALATEGGGARYLRLEPNGSTTSFVLESIPGGAGEGFDFEAWAELNEIDEVVVQGYSMPPLREALLECLDAGIRVTSFSEFVESNYRCVPVGEIDHGWFLATEARGLHPYYQVFKRAMDIAVAGAGMVLSLPLLLAAAVLIRMSGPGAVFYSQVRVGLRNRPFRIYKLRTMRTDAEAGGAKWATKGDSRVTAIGKVLRKTRLDEVPQFWNILKGDMAFIGPRPERPEFVGDLADAVPFYNQRHLVKPGLTGWAQINCAYAASAEDTLIKLKYDLYYVKHASLNLDLHILVRTVGAIMKGAR